MLGVQKFAKEAGRRPDEETIRELEVGRYLGWFSAASPNRLSRTVINSSYVMNTRFTDL